MIMAVELLITNNSTGKRELVPIATAKVFHEYWLKGCAELNLRLVPRLEDGITDFTTAEIPRAIEELRRLLKWFDKTQPPQSGRALATRVVHAIEAFERALNDPAISIG